jgi:hypothetical protein
MLLAGRAFAQPAPQPLSLIDVPFISQSEALCGGAAAAMILRFWGERGLTAESFAHLLDPGAAGIRTGALVGELRARGWSATAVDGTAALLGSELTAGRPVLTLIQDRPGVFHYVVIVGATGTAVVFHDPARAPFRAMSRDEFEARWRAADRWMAVVTPSPKSQIPNPESQIPNSKIQVAPVPAPQDQGSTTSYQESCPARVGAGVAAAQANELGAAAETLLASLSCPGAVRELAGVRLLQQRWPDVTALASLATAEDPADAHAWRLLGTSRFVQDQPLEALAAWNRAGEPRLDRISVLGLERTRQRVVEGLMATDAGTLITPAAFRRAGRRLEELPSAAAARLEYVPVAGGLAELRATVFERPLLPSAPWSYAGIAARAAVRRELGLAIGSIAGGGETLTAAWRFWPGRPGISLELAAPAPAWSRTGGTWTVHASYERQPFDAGIEPVRRSSAGLTVASWTTSRLRLAVDGGVDRWRGRGVFAGGGVDARYLSPGDRVDAEIGARGWRGDRSGFSTARTRVTLLSTRSRSGFVYVARAGAATASAAAPADIWFGGDTGHARPVLLRAHPLLDGAELRTDQLGRTLVHASGEAQRWWAAPAGVRVAAAAFADSARVVDRLQAGARADVDAGLGVRLALPGLSGVFRLDVGKGLRDGATAVSFVYDVSSR